MTFGVKMLNWLDIFERVLTRFETAAEEIKIGQISGPVGTFSNIDPKIEEMTCELLGLKPARISTQIISRDYHAYFMQSLLALPHSILRIKMYLCQEFNKEKTGLPVFFLNQYILTNSNISSY